MAPARDAVTMCNNIHRTTKQVNMNTIAWKQLEKQSP